MKREGTGKPHNEDIALDADVSMRELRFEEVPDPQVHFWGNTERNSVWKSKRENLPDEVQEGVIYRDARVRLRIATEIVERVERDRNSWNSRGQDGVRISLRKGSDSGKVPDEKG